MNQSKANKKRKAWDIILWILVGTIFIIAAFGLFLRFRKNQVYFFGNRYDAVLSKSMATVNEVIRDEYEEKGWTNQFKKGTLLVSTKITEETELKEGDIVIFINPDNNKITAHRIVKVSHDGIEKVYIIRADAAKPGEEDGQRAFQKQELQSKVKRSVPFVGYIAGYITSFWGILAEASIIVIYVVYQVISSKNSEKEKSVQTNKTSDQSLPLPKNKKEEKTKSNQKKTNVVEKKEETNTPSNKNTPVRSEKTGRFVSTKKKE